MIYWYTGQPGHGKTLHGVTRALEYRDQGRPVYVCNVTGFDYEKTRCLPMTPENFRDWQSFLPEGAVALVDEAYQHGMLPKRPPGSKLPKHVEDLATHRHLGVDFIFISQSPAKQCDEFVHDLIDRHIHVRRRWGTPLVHLREFDYFERNPVKATPSVLRRVKLPKRAMGCYKSTAIDTTERRIPWYVWALGIGLPLVVGGAFWQIRNVEAAITGEKTIEVSKAADVHAAEDGATATAEGAGASAVKDSDMRMTDYVGWLTPRIPGQPWTAPAYDDLAIPSQAPRVFCASFGPGELATGDHAESSCTCLTEQGTLYAMQENRCAMIARRGQYEPFRNERVGDRQRLDDVTQRAIIAGKLAESALKQSPAGTIYVPQPGVTVPPVQQQFPTNGT